MSLSPRTLTTAGRALAGLAALSALAAAISCIGDLSKADNATLVVQSWRMYGLFLCTGLFALLAARPEGNGAVWALGIANKAALTLTAAHYMTVGGIAESAKTVSWDGGLTVVLIAAYLLCRTGAARRSATTALPSPTSAG